MYISCISFGKLFLIDFIDFKTFLKFYFIFKLYNIVLVLPNIEMNPSQVDFKTFVDEIAFPISFLIICCWDI